QGAYHPGGLELLGKEPFVQCIRRLPARLLDQPAHYPAVDLDGIARRGLAAAEAGRVARNESVLGIDQVKRRRGTVALVLLPRSVLCRAAAIALIGHGSQYAPPGPRT